MTQQGDLWALQEQVEPDRYPELTLAFWGVGELDPLLSPCPKPTYSLRAAF